MRSSCQLLYLVCDQIIIIYLCRCFMHALKQLEMQETVKWTTPFFEQPVSLSLRVQFNTPYFDLNNWYSGSSALLSLHPGLGTPLTFFFGFRHFISGCASDSYYHWWTDAATTTKAHYACLNVSKALIATGIHILTDNKFFEAEVWLYLNQIPFDELSRVV